jgi:hypothetical protein
VYAAVWWRVLAAKSLTLVGARAIVSETDHPCQGLRPHARHTVAKFGDAAGFSEMDELTSTESSTSLAEAESFEDLPGKWQSAILEAEQNRPKLRVVSGD